jgi:hypothetical protein
MPRAEMDDYSALAQRISVSVREVRGCLLLSRDGMILGAYPEEDESLAKGAWLRFCALGEPERSFVEFTDQVWAYVKRGAYASFAVAEAGVRPGILVDQLEQALVTADEGRARRDTLRVPDASAAPSGKPRTSLHPSAGKPQPEPEPAEVSVVADVPLTAAEADHGHWKRKAAPDAPAAAEPAGATKATADPEAAVAAPPNPGPTGEKPGDLKATEPPGSALGKEPKKLAGGLGGVVEEETEVDRVLLAKEFSGLLQMDSGDDEVNP